MIRVFPFTHARYRMATQNYFFCSSASSSMHKMEITLLTLCCFIVYLERAESTLISKSVIEQCISGDVSEPQTKNGETCSKKFVVSMTIRSDQVKFIIIDNSESLFIGLLLHFSKHLLGRN